MVVRLLLLLVCLCTLYSQWPVLALQEEVSTLESRQGDLMTIQNSETILKRSSTNGLPMHVRQLLSRQLVASKAQDDEPKTSIHLEASTSVGTSHESSTLRIMSADKGTGITSGPCLPPSKRSIHCGESHCEDPTNLISACLWIPGDEAHKISLLITNAGDSEVQVKVVAPEYLVVHPPAVSVPEGKSETIQLLMNSKYEPHTLDFETVNKVITVITPYGDCEIAVPVEYLHSSFLEQESQISSYLPSVTPQVVAYLAVLILVGALVGAWLCYKCCWKQQARDVKYQQLEMNLPGQCIPKERDEQCVEGWDEFWDDDWEDAEAAKLSSQLTQNPSSRGLGARRGNKDGWDKSCND